MGGPSNGAAAKAGYLEPSAINWLVDNAPEAASAVSSLRAAGYRPVIGLHTIYELARTFLNPKNDARGQTLFAFIRDLDPSLTPGTRKLMIQEIVSYRTGTAVLPFLDHLDQAATRAEVNRLAAVVFDGVARLFIEARERDIGENYPKVTQGYIRKVVELGSANREAVPRFGTFEAAASFFEPKVPSIIREIVDRGISASEAAALSGQLARLPAIRSAVRANLYLMWICISKKACPAFDKLDDYRHIIEASYCDAIITQDRQLLRTVRKINPWLEPLDVTALCTQEALSAD